MPSRANGIIRKGTTCVVRAQPPCARRHRTTLRRSGLTGGNPRRHKDRNNRWFSAETLHFGHVRGRQRLPDLAAPDILRHPTGHRGRHRRPPGHRLVVFRSSPTSSGARSTRPGFIRSRGERRRFPAVSASTELCPASAPTVLQPPPRNGRHQQACDLRRSRRRNRH